MVFVISVLSADDKIYWDEEIAIDSGTLGKVKVITSGNIIAVVYADMRKYSENNNLFDIKMKYSNNGLSWSQEILLAENIFSNNDFGVDYDVCMDSVNNVYMVYRKNQSELVIDRFTDLFTDNSFKKSEIHKFSSDGLVYLPTIALDRRNSIYILYSEYIQTERIYFRKLNSAHELIFTKEIGESLVSAINPVFKIYGNNIYIAFQAKYANPSKIYYNIFLEYSSDGGDNWDRNVVINSDDNDRHNQRPDILVENNMLNLVYEEDDQSYTSHIRYRIISLDDFSTVFDDLVSFVGSEGFFPRINKTIGMTNIFWYDNISGSFQNYYCRYLVQEKVVENTLLRQKSGRSFNLDISTHNMNPVIVWNHSINNRSIVYFLQKDNYVQSPALTISGVKDDEKINRTQLSCYWSGVNDISGIKEYKLYATQNIDASIPDSVSPIYYTIRSRNLTNLTDGKWYIMLKAYDNAGNSSSATVRTVIIDTIPPDPPLFEQIEKDEDNSLITNSPEISWSSYDDDVLKYEYVYRNFVIQDNESYDEMLSIVDQRKNDSFFNSMTVRTGTSFKLEDQDNGILLVGTRCYDTAGNMSDINWNHYILNDYIPKTYITRVRQRSLAEGGKLFNIEGRGFRINGEIEEIFLDSDMSEPYDYTMSRRYFRVINDRLIIQNRVFDIEDGKYYIGVSHPERGIHFYERSIFIENRWLFIDEEVDQNIFSRVRFLPSVDGTFIILIIIAFTWMILILAVIFSILRIIREKRYMNKLLEEMKELSSNFSRGEYNKTREVIMKIKMGLAFKYTLLILVLVVFVLSVTSVSIGAIALSNEKKNLTDEIKKRFMIVTENFERAVEDILYFDKDLTEATDQADIVSKLPNVGFASYYLDDFESFVVRFGDDMNKEVFFSSIDDDIVDTLNDDEKDRLIREYVFSDEMRRMISIFDEQKLPDYIDRFVFRDLVIEQSDDKDIDWKDFYTFNEDKEIYILNENIDTDKNLFWKFLYTSDVIDRIRIMPEFTPKDLQDSYIFTAPLFTGTQESPEYKGFIALGYSFEETIKLLKDETNNLIQLTLIVTAIAIVLSIFGSIVLATSTIRPIKKMYEHVNVISSTEDYEKLVGTEHEKLEINTGDEISVLANSINDMTNKLIEKAMSDKQLLLGKEIQKKFIPLEPMEADDIEIYGFYNGAKGVSGDYFDYKKLDDSHYAFIICDVAGKAVPAALIMVQISTIFHAHFSNFVPGKNKLETVPVVNQINDTVAERGFQGRFAAILVVIFNVKTGKAIMTNAGYTQLLVYRAKTKKTEFVQLDEKSGAAGVFPSYMLPNPYVQESVQINHGDIIFLFSDGIEESRNGKTIISPDGDEQPEEFGMDRLRVAIEAERIKKPRNVIDSIMKAEKEFRGELEQYDDLTLLAVMRK